MTEKIHIVSLDAPSPPDYGGALELFYKIPALSKAGKKIILHYFSYKKNRDAQGLERYCSEIYRYERLSIFRSLFSSAPYIVQSRNHPELIRRLRADQNPVILEGIHCSGILPSLQTGRKIVLRLHNDEAEYYKQLALAETNLLKRIFFRREKKRLALYQAQLPKTLVVAALSLTDRESFQSAYGFTNCHFIPCFLPWQHLQAPLGTGSYCLYHGNLSVSENAQAASWLIDQVFTDLPYTLIVAGRGANNLARKYALPNVQFVDSPTDEDLTQLIRNAQVNVLPSFSRTGVKYKILHALFEGRFCITNANGIAGSGIQKEKIHVREDAPSLISCIHELFRQEFSNADIEARREVLRLYDNERNAQKLSELL